MCWPLLYPWRGLYMRPSSYPLLYASSSLARAHAHPSTPPTLAPTLAPARPRPRQYPEGDAALQRVAEDALAREGVLFAAAKYSCLERSRPPPSLRVAVTAAHSREQIEAAVAALRAACRRVLA